MAFNFAPRGWAFCNGQLMPINQNQALFSLLGTTYGGDGRTTFALPDLRGRVPVAPGSTITLGQKVGEESVTLTRDQADHAHTVLASATEGSVRRAVGNQLALAADEAWAAQTAAVAMHPDMVSPATGGAQAHNNMQPSFVVNFVIALQGIFPSRN